MIMCCVIVLFDCHYCVFFLEVQRMIKELEDKKQTHMPAYTELIQKRNEVEVAQDISLDQRTYGTSRLESMDVSYIKAKVNILKSTGCRWCT